MVALEIAFWASLGLIAWSHVGYPAVLWLLARARGRRDGFIADAPLPSVSLIVAAHDEEAVIAERVRNALALDYPRELLQVIVVSDGSTDGTVELANEAGADVVIDLPRSGKVPAQNAGADRARGEVLAFSDANALWRADALRHLVASLAEARTGYVCGQVRFTRSPGASAAAGSPNEEGLYWRYEMAIRELESGLGGVTAGNGAIYAVMRRAYLPLGPAGSHDLSFPFLLAKRGWRAAYSPEALAEEPMVETIEGEFARKRRMMRGVWDEVVRDGMLSPRGYSPLYAFQVASHRALRYLSPLLHLVALATNIALVGEGTVYTITLGAQLAFMAAAALAGVIPVRPFRLARYYLLVTASIAAGLWDRIRLGVPGAWEKAEGTR